MPARATESDCARHPLPERLRVCPVEVAYVLRWIELVSGRRWASWEALTDPSGGRPPAATEREKGYPAPMAGDPDRRPAA